MTDRTESLVKRLDDVRRELSSSDLDATSIFLCARTIERLAQEVSSFAGSGSGPADTPPTQRIAVLGDLTLDFISKAIACAVAREGVVPFLYQCPFGSLKQQILDRSSELYRFKPDIVVLAVDARTELDPMSGAPTVNDVETKLADDVSRNVDLWRQITDNLNAKVFQQTYVPPASLWRGGAERPAPWSPLYQIDRLNALLSEAGQGQVQWIDIAREAAGVGLRNWSSTASYTSAKLPFDIKHLPDYLDAFGGTWRAAFGRSKKVLVLDLDNTMWGGVIGDDGVDNLALGPPTARGEAFAAWGRYVQELHERGVVLAVASKNDPAIVSQIFDHSHFHLRRDMISSFQCSWGDKAESLRIIARELNLGLDSFVFCDDNPAECDQIRSELPEVAVVNMGTDPAGFVTLLDRGHWFDISEYTLEDRQRGASYAARAQAQRESSTASDLPAFLKGLCMTADFQRASEGDLIRLAQMELKTNQFNLTTRRYSDEDLRDLVSSDKSHVFKFSLSDKFGDHGLVSSIVLKEKDGDLTIDSWLMSCRVFSRGAEQYIMSKLLSFAVSREAIRVVGTYIPSAKNQVVSDLYQRLGFQIDESKKGSWFIEVARPQDGKIENFINDR